MTYIAASRNALERALRSCRVEDGSPAPLFREGDLTHIAYRLIASGAVTDAATLADAAERVQDYLDSALLPSERDGHYDVGCDDDVPLWSDDLRALTAALTERAR